MINRLKTAYLILHVKIGRLHTDIMNIFITYGDEKYTESKKRIVEEAKYTGMFDKIIDYSPMDISKNTKDSILMNYSKGGGLWIWKPDVLLSTINNAHDGDKIVYADAGCTLRRSKEWINLFRELDYCSMYAMKINQRTFHWTKKEVIEFFNSNPIGWTKEYQCCATIILKVDEFTKKFINEWLNIMTLYPEFVVDVSPEEKILQHEGFYENRHDQTIYNALIYKYKNTGKIKLAWEHIEGYDMIWPQAIVATRLKDGRKITAKFKIIGTIKCIVKHILRLF